MSTPSPSDPGRDASWARHPRAALMFAGIVGFALALTLALWGGVAYESRESHALLEAEARKDLNHLTRAVAEHSFRTLQSADQAALLIQQEVERLGPKLDLPSYVSRGLIPQGLFNQVGVIDAQGRFRPSPQTGGEAVDLSDRAHFQVHRRAATQGLQVSVPLVGRTTGKWSLQVTRRINRPDGQFDGVAVVSLDPTLFTDFYSDLDLGSHGRIALVGMDGVVRAGRVGRTTGFGEDISASALFRRMHSAPKGDGSITEGASGSTVFYSFRQLPGMPLGVVLAVDQDEALAPARARDLRHRSFVALITLVIWGFGALAALLLRQQQRFTDQLRESQERAERASRHKSEFMASMSHELRTPLNGVLGYAEFLRDNAADETSGQFANIIYASSRQLLQSVNAILDLAKIEAGKMTLVQESVNVSALVQQVVAGQEMAAQVKGLTLSAEVAPDVPGQLQGDPRRLAQVLHSLVSNAIRYTEHGYVLVRVSATPDHIRFSVVDTGPGIATQYHARLFDRFRELGNLESRAVAGGGLGLALAREVVELMGGRMGLTSAVGLGSDFHFDLPLAGAPGT